MSLSANRNVDDFIRDKILRYLHEVHRKARSPRSAGKGIQEIQRELKKRYGYKQQQVATNLDYLVQQQWAREDVSSRMYKTPGGTLQAAEKVTYKITHIGIDKLEHPSAFQRSDLGKMNINLTNIGGVTVAGNGNVVNTHFANFSRQLEQLRGEFQDSELADKDKLIVVSDIDSLLAQLQSPEPNKTVVAKLWEGIQKTAALAGISSAVVQASSLVAPLITGS